MQMVQVCWHSDGVVVGIPTVDGAHPGYPWRAQNHWLLTGTGQGAGTDQQADGQLTCLDQAGFKRAADQKLAVRCVESAQKADHVKLHGAQRDGQQRADRFVFLSFYYPDQDFTLTWRQGVVWVVDFEFCASEISHTHITD